MTQIVLTRLIHELGLKQREKEMSWTAYFHSSASQEWVDSRAIHEDSLSWFS